VNRKLHLALLFLLLCAAGLSSALYKALVLSFPLLPEATASLWQVEASISFNSLDIPAKLSLFLPRSSKAVAVVDESFISHGYGLTMKQTKLNRTAIWSIRRSAGRQQLFYRALIRPVEGQAPKLPPPPKEAKPEFAGAELAAAQAVIADLREHSADTETLTNSLLQKVNDRELDDNLRLIVGKKPDRFKRIVAASRILNTAGIPARAVHGIRLMQQTKEAELEHWLEVHDPASDSWLPFGRDIEEGQAEETYLIWWRGSAPLADLEGGSRLRVKIALTPSQEEAIDSAMARAQLTGRSFYEYSLFSLPISTQTVYRIILLVPIGALLVVVLRNIIGIQTFGTFMPVLIALAFRETELLLGLVFFTGIIVAGLAIRFYLEHLKLLLVPRLAAIVVIVVLLMAALSVITHKLGIERGLSISLFPMIIMTMTIERMSLVWEENGPFAAIAQGLGSLLAAAAIYLIITNHYVEHLVFVFPETLLVVLAFILLLGRYCGYRLFELFRFASLARD